MIAGLTKRRQGDGRTEVEKLGAMMTTACPLCKRSNWTADVLWVSTDTMGWKALGGQLFDDLIADRWRGRLVCNEFAQERAWRAYCEMMSREALSIVSAKCLGPPYIAWGSTAPHLVPMCG